MLAAEYSGELWIGHTAGKLQSCDSSGTCTDHGDKGNAIYAMAVFNGKLWIGHYGGRLQSCDSSGTCTDHGDKGQDINTMAVFNGELWIGHAGGDTLWQCSTVNCGWGILAAFCNHVIPPGRVRIMVTRAKIYSLC
jgi:ligand-binding sensor domain-containing protein